MKLMRLLLHTNGGIYGVLRFENGQPPELIIYIYIAGICLASWPIHPYLYYSYIPHYVAGIPTLSIVTSFFDDQHSAIVRMHVRTYSVHLQGC